MHCGGGHLGFLIHIKNRNVVKDILMIIQLQFGFSQFISLREEDLWNFSQSKYIIGPGIHVEYMTGTKNRYFVEDHPRNIPAKFCSNWPSGCGEEAWNVKSLQTTNDGRQVMAIVPMDLWSRWINETYLVLNCRFLQPWPAAGIIKLQGKVQTDPSSSLYFQ